ncbi:MAG: hypothetical protein ACYS99_05945 [Planctomycetota bacterium]
MADLPFSHREPLSPEEEKLGIEFYTAGKVDGGREALRRVRDALEAIQIPHEYQGYLPEGWEAATKEVWGVIADLEEKYQDPFWVVGMDRPDSAPPPATS